MFPFFVGVGDCSFDPFSRYLYTINFRADLAIHPCDVVLKQVQKKQFRGYFVFVSVHSGLAARGGSAWPYKVAG